MTLKPLALAFCLLLIPFTAHSQQTTIQNPQAVAFAAQAMAALSHTTQVSDITLTGTATRTAGSESKAERPLKALGIRTAAKSKSCRIGDAKRSATISLSYRKDLDRARRCRPAMAHHNMLTEPRGSYPS